MTIKTEKANKQGDYRPKRYVELDVHSIHLVKEGANEETVLVVKSLKDKEGEKDMSKKIEKPVKTEVEEKVETSKNVPNHDDEVSDDEPTPTNTNESVLAEIESLKSMIAELAPKAEEKVEPEKEKPAEPEKTDLEVISERLDAIEKGLKDFTEVSAKLAEIEKGLKAQSEKVEDIEKSRGATSAIVDDEEEVEEVETEKTGDDFWEGMID